MTTHLHMRLVVEDDGRVHGHVVEEVRDTGPAPPIPGQTDIESTLAEEGLAEEAQAGEGGDGKLFEAPQTVSDNAAAAAHGLRREVAQEIEALGLWVQRYEPRSERAARASAGHRPPLVCGSRDDDLDTVLLVVTVAATEKNLRKPNTGWTIAKDAYRTHGATAQAEGIPLVYVFQDRSCARHDELVPGETMFDGQGGNGNFWQVRRAGWRPMSEVLLS